MRRKLTFTFVLFIVLALAGCSLVPSLSGTPPAGDAGSSSTPTVASSTPGAPAAAAPTPGISQTMSSDPTIAAIQTVIQKADQEQQDAFAKNDPTIMKDTATTSYYNQLVQINSDMANAGVSAIKLVQIEWGPVTLTNPTTATATTYETWQTTYSDGSVEQAREQNVYTMVQEQGVWKIQADDHPNSSTGSSGGSPASGPSGSVPPSAPTPAVPPPVSTPVSQANTSRNWAGYAATSGTFTGVTGTWTVPQALSAGSFGTDATWVGIGGVRSHDLIQAGTEETTTASGAVQWDAWIETLPQPSRQVRLAVKAGDSVTISINQQGAADQWLIKFVNNTTKETYQTTVQYASSLSSAEWIEEAPSTARGGRILPLDSFGTVEFSGGTTVQNGKTVTIAQSGAQPITLVDANGTPLVTPSVLTADGQGFAVTRSSSTSAP